MPGVLKVTLPGDLDVELDGDPPGNTQEYCAADVVVLKDTAPPAWMVTSADGDAITPEGGVVLYGES